MEIKNPEHVIVQITPEELLGNVVAMKKNGLRLSQICCAYSNEKIELSYSFADDDTNEYINLRIVMDKEDEVCSITEFSASCSWENCGYFIEYLTPPSPVVFFVPPAAW